MSDNSKNSNIITLGNKKGNDKYNLIDSIINDYGYGIKNFINIINSIILYFYSYHVLYYISNFNIILHKNYGISYILITILSCLVYLMKFLGAITAGYFSNEIPRKNLIYLYILFVLIFNTVHALENKLWSLIMFLQIGSVLSGITDPIVFDILCENLPLRFRGFFLCFSMISMSLNNFFQIYLINVFSIGNTTEYQKISLINSAVFFVFLIWLLIFFDDSARNYILSGKSEKGFNILSNIRGNPITIEEREIIKNQIQKGNSNICGVNLREIFKVKYRRTTLIFMFLNFLISVANDGQFFILNVILKDFIPQAENQKISKIASLTYLFLIISNVYAGLLSEVKFLKRNFAILLSLILYGIISIIFIFEKSLFQVWIYLNFFFLNSCGALSLCFASEFFPTKIRDLSQGFIMAIGYLGSLLGQPIVYLIYYIHKTFSLNIFNIMVSIFCVILVLSNKSETQNKSLDPIDEIEKDTDESNEILIINETN